MILTHLSRCLMWCKSGQTYVWHKIFKMDHPNPKLFFQKNHYSCYKKRYKYENKKDTTYLLKKLKSFHATWQLWTSHLATKKIILIGIRRKQISFFDPIFRNIFYAIVTVTITERFNNHFSRIMWFVATWLFLLGCVPKFIIAPLLYYCSLGQKFPNCYPLP